MKASQTTIRRSSSGSPRSGSSQSTSMIRVFIDKGTDPREDSAENLIKVPETIENVPAVPEPFEPVFPVTEDLVIYVNEVTANVIFDTVLRYYKQGNYLTSSESADSEVSPISPLSNFDETLNKPNKHESELTLQGYDDFSQSRGEYDPYSPYISGSSLLDKLWPYPPTLSRPQSGFCRLDPPTPLTTPPPPLGHIPDKFVQFTPGHENVINIQNALRKLLALYFPTGETGYSQHHFSVVTEAERMWKPVWSCDETEAKECRTVDQIIALGCEDGVRKDLLNQMSGQIERLGTKRSGINRSGKLDLRYDMPPNLSLSMRRC